MSSPSLWESVSNPLPAFPRLKDKIEVDVIVIGAGITGLTTALELTKAGKKVAILEAEKISSGTTGFSTGNLYIPIQPYFQTVLSKFNQQIAEIVAQARKAAIDYIEHQVKEYAISCNFIRRPWYIYTSDADRLKFLQKEIDAMRQIQLDIKEIKELPLAVEFKLAAKLENQARIHPVNYAIGLAQELKKLGCQIFENTRVLAVEEKKTLATVKTENVSLSAKHVVIATHTPIGINSSQFFTAPYRSYVVALKLENDVYPDGNFWDTGEPHHAISTHPLQGIEPALLMIAGSHHKTGQSKDEKAHYEELLNFGKQHFPVAKVAYHWSAQHYHSADDLPYIGLAHSKAKHTYIATGFFADGLVYGTVAGIILKHIIMDEKNAWIDVFNSTRLTLFKSAGFLVKEGSNIFAQYVSDYVSKPSKDFSDLKSGEGKIAEIDGEKCAVHRDEKGKLHAVSAVCTHMSSFLFKIRLV